MDTTVAPRGQAGFTLVELLVVVAVLSVLTVVATLAVSAPDTGPSRDAAHLLARYTELRDAAILSGRSQGLKIDRTALAVARPNAEAPGWQIGAAQPWGSAATLTLTASGLGTAPGAPNIVLLSGGQSTAFAMRFSRRDQVIECRTDGWTGLTCASN